MSANPPKDDPNEPSPHREVPDAPGRPEPDPINPTREVPNVPEGDPARPDPGTRKKSWLH